ncbi:DNA recombination protein RmuC [Elongatibacter sediminis]|uniref:DNA recombination protein RmuC n=1 Tax=Elongatibacter sediminis TaxID=3119006 RepID=A0AAW9RJA6_9GAMM
MNDWLMAQGVASPLAGLWVGLLAGLLLAVLIGWLLSRRAARAERAHWEPELARRDEKSEELREALARAEQQCAVLQSRGEDREAHFREQLQQLEAAEKRLAEHFDRLARQIFEERSEKLSDLNRKQLDTLLTPLAEKLTEFRNTVNETHKQEVAQHQVLQVKLKELEQLNVRLHDDATNLTRALTSSVKAQGNWGEQQLERLLNLAGLEKGREYSTQVSVTTETGQRIQPDLVLHLPEGRSIIMDSKVSLNAWTRYQAETEEPLRVGHLADHVRSVREHIKSLGEKRYAEIAELQALDFVLMFVPIEAALIEALQQDAELPAFALERKVALVSPTNLLATLRTVASVWSIHKQNTNALEIASRAGLLYDKFAGFVDNLGAVGERLRQAQKSYDDAFGQLSTGAGNLLRQAELLSQLGARHTKQLDSRLLERARESDGQANPGLTDAGPSTGSED